MPDKIPPSEMSAGNGEKLPSISFIVPTRNEERHIDGCIGSLLAQNYPQHLISVLVVDGRSEDGTRDVVRRRADEDDRVRLLDNPRRITPAAFNIGIRAATSDVLSIVSAHSCTDPSFARVVAEALEESGAQLVGGRTVAMSAVDTPTARAICRATSSPLGLGNSRHHYDDSPGWVDTAYPSAYRRALVDQIGLFDESLIRNQDDEYHLRARRAGHRMWYEPRLRADYVPRATLKDLAKQYFDYGYWRAYTLRKHGTVASARHVVPGLFVLGLASAPVAMRARALRGPWLTVVAVYVGAIAGAGLWALRAAPASESCRLPLALATLHLSYGLGFWRGVGSLLASTFRPREAQR